MKLIQARIRGLGTLMESRWFDLSPQLNLFQFPDSKGQIYGENFLRILQTINPTYAIQTVKPFASYPKFIEQDGYPRRVNPTKRTVSLAVFTATPSLVKKLGSISEWLYETDRIEVGRRLDYSRWINFVELAASTRWSEISADMQTLLDQVQHSSPYLTSPLTDIISSLKPADRIKNELADQLIHWLQNLPPELQKDFHQLIEPMISAAMRADHFRTARQMVRTRLPLFVLLGSSDSDSASLHNLLQLISDRINPTGKKPGDDAQTFLDELNEQLQTLQFSGKILQLGRTPPGLSLNFAGKPMQMSAGDPLSSLSQLQAKACLAIACSRLIYRTEPILLFAGPEQALPSTLHSELADFVNHISSTCQCLYSFSQVNIFPDDVVGKRYSADDLNMT